MAFQWADGGNKGTEKAVQAALKSGALNLTNRELEEFPASVFAPPSESNAGAVDWWMYADTTRIDVSYNRIRAIPPEIAQLSCLQVLHAAHNQIEMVPQELLGLVALVKLHLGHNQISVLPAGLSSLEGLIDLQLSNNSLVELPEDLGMCPALETLALDENRICSLPPSLGRLHALQKLLLANNQLQELPAQCVAGLVQLREIEVGHNAVRSLPTELFLLPHLTRIDARQNQIAQLPHIPDDLPGCQSNLAELYLGRNQLQSLPASIGALRCLAVLDVGDNSLAELPKEVAQMKPLRLLDVRNNNLSTLPPQLCKLGNLNKVVLDGNPMRFIRRNIIEQGTRAILDFLRTRLPEDEIEVEYSFDPESLEATIRNANTHRTLDLAGRGLSEVPRELFDGELNLGALAKASFAENALVALPASLTHMAALSELNVSSNRLCELPDALGALQSLSDLNAARNELTDIPRCLSALQQLKRLDLGGNKIRAVRTPLPPFQALDELHLCSNGMTGWPAGLGALSSLSVLNLAGNKLSALPEDQVLALTSLQSLDVSNNDISDLPPKMGRMRHIRALVLHGNPLRSIRRPIIDKGTIAVLDHLLSRIVDSGDAAAAEALTEGAEDVDAIMEGFNIRIGAIEEEMTQPGLSGPKVYALKKKLAMEKAAKKKEERRLAQKT